jgi:hypothetical protein
MFHWGSPYGECSGGQSEFIKSSHHVIIQMYISICEFWALSMSKISRFGTTIKKSINLIEMLHLLSSSLVVATKATASRHPPTPPLLRTVFLIDRTQKLER